MLRQRRTMTDLFSIHGPCLQRTHLLNVVEVDSAVDLVDPESNDGLNVQTMSQLEIPK